MNLLTVFLCTLYISAMRVIDTFCSNNSLIISSLLAVLNSKLGDWYIRQLGVTRNGGYFEYKPMFVSELPIPILSVSEQEPFVELVNVLLNKTNSKEDVIVAEQNIDQLVYKLYGLSDDEIEYINTQST